MGPIAVPSGTNKAFWAATLDDELHYQPYETCRTASEVNEAFASVVAIAHGHPLGATGVVLLTKLAHELKRIGQDMVLSTMCIGVRQSVATVLERI